ncbi:MAG: HU family DNA-binding protein [Roseicyclus sp.]|nr:HU family DNA-binding protein [Roseicyclus sp.]
MATKTTPSPATSPAKRKSTSAGPRRTGTLGTTKSAAKAAAASDPVSTPAPAPAPAPAPKPAAVVEPEVIEEGVTASASAPAPAGSGPPDDDRLRRPDLIEAIAARVSLKRSEAKMVFDVVLDEIGKALDASDEVVVPPLGKFMVKKRDQKPAGMMLTLKLKRASEDPTAGDLAPLAEPGEDS